jgi:hypothetical protein
MVRKEVLNLDRVRRIPKQFSWIDQELVRSGYVKRVSAEALGLYFLLVTVGDSQGLSYFSDRSLSEYLSRDVSKLRAELIRADLIAYRHPLYQVLSFNNPSLPQQQLAARGGGLQSIAQVLQSLGGRS